MCFVYKITNKINGKCYIGKTIRSLDERWQQHWCDARAARYSNKFHNALRKYGRENFDIYVVAEVDNPDILDEVERMAIEHFDSFKNGYNSTLGGNGYSYKARRNLLNRGDYKPSPVIRPEKRRWQPRSLDISTVTIKPHTSKSLAIFKEWVKKRINDDTIVPPSNETQTSGKRSKAYEIFREVKARHKPRISETIPNGD
jgi:GIY-YIG catalytic domain